MPGMGGLELQRRLAAENVHTSIIFVTARGEQEVSAAEVRGGAVAVRRQQLYHRNRIVRGWRLRASIRRAASIQQ